MLIADESDGLKSTETGAYQEIAKIVQQKELDHVTEIIERTMPDKAEEIEKISVIVAEKQGMSLEKAVAEVLNVIQFFCDAMQRILAPLFGEPDKLADVEQSGPLDRTTAWDRKKAREKQKAVERAASSRFRQYKARESAWFAQRRTSPRRREWRGPWKEKR